VSLPDLFPSGAGPLRDAAILAAVRAGTIEYAWSAVTTSYGSHSATFQVFSDGLKLGGVRLTGSASLCQQVADLLNCCLPTPRLLDEAWLQAGLRIPPAIISPNSSDTATLVRASEMIDAAGGSAAELVMPIGKPWVLAKAISQERACLYGWQSSTPIPGVPLYGSPATPGVKVVQPLSPAHAPDYVDYSSAIWLVSRNCTVDGDQKDLWAVLQDPALAPLCSHEGALSVVRQPGVPVLQV
jgi:hypothetical protein